MHYDSGRARRNAQKVLVRIAGVLALAAAAALTGCADGDEWQQVYYRNGYPYEGNCEVTGLPSKTLDSGYYPWKLYGKVEGGKMHIAFPNVKLDMGSLRSCGVYFQKKNEESVYFVLRRPDLNYWWEWPRAEVIYATEPLTFENGFSLEAGWNFVVYEETVLYPGDGGSRYFPVVVSTTIEGMYSRGYRWYISGE